MIVFIYVSSAESQTSTVYGYDLPTSSTARTDIVSSKNSCPFRRNSASVDQLVTQARSALENLAKKEASCPATIEISKDIDKTLAMIMQYQKENTSKQYAEGSAFMECENYQSHLLNEYTLVLNQKRLENEAWVQSRIDRYSSCANSNDFEKCAAKIYSANLEKMALSCEERSRFQKINYQKKLSNQVLNQLTNNIKVLIENSKNCPDDRLTSKYIIQATIGAVTSIGSIAANPITGVALNLSGDILSNLVQKFFKTRSAKELVSYIDAETEFEETNCLYFELQNRALSCSTILRIRVSEIYKEQTCAPTSDSSQFVSLQLLSHLDNIERRMTEYNDLDLVRDLKILHSLLMDPITSSELDPKTNKPFSSTIDLLKKINSTPSRIILQLTKVADEVDLVIKDPTKSNEEVATALKKYIPLIKSPEYNGLALANYLKAGLWHYYKDTDKENLYVQNVNNLAIANAYEKTMALYDTKMRSIKMVIDDSGAQNKIDIAHTAYLNGFKDIFDNRLKNLYDRYKKNVDKQSNEDSLNDMIPLMQMCSLNASAFYFAETDMSLKARNSVEKNPSSDFREACKMFSCEIPFFEGDKYSDKERPQKFRMYQCSINYKYSDAIDTLINNMLKSGKPCP